MRCAFWAIGIMAILPGVFHPVPEAPFCIQEKTPLLSPESTAIEKRLLALANKERETRGLPPLHFSDGLAGLARRHSADMASSGTLSHLSSSGESLQDRLVQAGFLFEKAGENIARSETYVADLIHRSLMESPEHRESLLDPDCDTVGIGVVETKEGSYFVTQDFVRGIRVLSEKEAKARVAGRIQEWRSARAFPPLLFREDADRLAQEYAKARIAETQIPSHAGLQREIDMFTVFTPSLGGLDERSFHIDDPGYDEGGLGVSFGRPRSNPGGAYCVVVVLYPRNKYILLTDSERDGLIRGTVNSMRQKSGLGSLEADEYLDKEAARVAARISSGGSSAAPRLSGLPRVSVFAFRSNDLERVPREIEEIVLAPQLNRIGLHVLFTRMDSAPAGEFLVVGIVR